MTEKEPDNLIKKIESINQKAISKNGFVFLDQAQRPYLCAKWANDQIWLFYWHKDRHWVSLRPVEQSEIWTFPRNLSQKEQDYYHKQHKIWKNKYLK